MTVLGSAISVAYAGTFLISLAPGEGIESALSAINDDGWIAGSYQPTKPGDSKDDHGFVGPRQGPYQTFQFSGDNSNGYAQYYGTAPRGINNAGMVIGVYSSLGGDCGTPVNMNDCRGFVRDPSGRLRWITISGRAPIHGIGMGINSKGSFVGEYSHYDKDHPELKTIGYLGKINAVSAVRVSDITLPWVCADKLSPTCIARIAPRGINAQGDIVGFFRKANGSVQGFVMRTIGEGVEVWVLNAQIVHHQTLGDMALGNTRPQSIKDNGDIAGSWEDKDGHEHGFVLKSNLKSWTIFEAPNAVETQAFQMNDFGQIAVSGKTAGGASVNYIYCPAAGPNGCTGHKSREELVGTERTDWHEASGAPLPN
ncbi:MAG TPA: hypothetical protein VNH64_09510 [Parvularculaceae bacterium]|nr:hypothetical protein [Parvularculaceae bacterium]